MADSLKRRIVGKMRFSSRLIRVPKSTIRSSLSSSLSSYESCHSSSQLHLKSNRPPCFGIAFDIDGVILRGTTPIGGSPQALNRLYDEHRRLKIPFLFLTNGGGIPESKRASELSKILGVKILPSQIVQGHSPFKKLVNRFENELVIAIGKGQPAEVMSEYGYKKVLSIDEYASYFENIDSLAPYKKWASNIENSTSKKFTPRYNIFSERVQAAFVVSDPVDWSRDIQVLCDILRTGGLPGKKFGYGCQPPLYFAADDLEYQAAFPSERLGMGAFRIALESIFNRVHPNALEYTTFGKPNPFVFKNAEDILKQIQPISQHDVYAVDNGEPPFFRSLYMIGDNPSVDIKGAKQAGRPWFSILTRTGVFKGKENHVEFPADLVVDTVEEAVDYILTKECSS